MNTNNTLQNIFMNSQLTGVLMIVLYAINIFRNKNTTTNTTTTNTTTNTTTTNTTTTTTTNTTQIKFNVPENFKTIKNKTTSFKPYESISIFKDGEKVMISFKPFESSEKFYIKSSLNRRKKTTIKYSTLQNTSTIEDILNSTCVIIKYEVDGNDYFRIDNAMNPNYSLDLNKNEDNKYILGWNNAWDINKSTGVSSTGNDVSTSAGFVVFDFTVDGLITPKKRFYYNSGVINADNTSFDSNNLYFSNSNNQIMYFSNSNNQIMSGDVTTIFELYISNINYNIPKNFNPLMIQKNYDLERTQPSPDTYLNSNLNSLYENTENKYQLQMVKNGGNSSVSTLHASNMLDDIIINLKSEGYKMRYDKDFYLAFRKAALNTILQYNTINNGVIGQNTVPHVFFTNEFVGDDDTGKSYHPFMVISSYSITDKPNFLTDIPNPPGDSSVPREAILADYVVKIPLKDYGNIINITDNILEESVGGNNLLSVYVEENVSYDSSESVYNYAGTSSIGIAIDGVVIYPVLNSTLTPAQEQAEISSLGIHVGEDHKLHYQADGQQSNNNGIDLYNLWDYDGYNHPPLIGIGYDGIALYGNYKKLNMDGEDIILDDYGGHSHGDYGYHYHAHTVLSNTIGDNSQVTDETYKINVLMKGAWKGNINEIPDFWNNNKPNVSFTENNNKYTGRIQEV